MTTFEKMKQDYDELINEIFINSYPEKSWFECSEEIDKLYPIYKDFFNRYDYDPMYR
jgi:hypothetical protein